RFVNDASHELRTPIAVIEGYSNMLARWGREDEKVLDESINAIKNESAHMKYLVEQLLFLARGDSGKTVLHPENLNLCDMMREIYEESLMIDEKHIYRYQESETPVLAQCDPTLMKQAVRILVDNAAKYTNEGDEILLSQGVQNGIPYLQVQDTGIGMEENDVAHMFERFYRADDARTYKGTGLGLSIAKWIIDKHRGHFEVTSRPGLGTRIRIVLG
ncbi:MAG: HAMP domain-containing histidine kinase, partial [Lachnospiraceae bacterium]|nr:HAMP domain-containing histidine kinase [Lachnospiraceae bacterium]